MAMRSLKAARVPTTQYARFENAAVAAVVADGDEVGKRESGLFNPAPRGDLAEASKSVAAFAEVAPQSPRPAEMLDTVVVTGDHLLTAQDLAIHEYLVAAAYEAGYKATRAGYQHDVVAREVEAPMRGILSFLGPSGRRGHVLKSLRALNATRVSYSIPGGRTVNDVPLLTGWHETDGEVDVVRFSLPSRVWLLLASQPSYGYLELAALASMSSRYGVHLYRHLALRMSRAKWDPVEPETVLEYTPEQAAAVIGFVDAPLNVGRLTTALKRAVGDLGGVRAFSVEYAEPRRRKAKGAPLVAFVLRVTMRPRQLDTVRLGGISDVLRPYTGAPDVPDLRVNSHVWDRAAAMAKEVGRYLFPNDISAAWFGALHEAHGGGPADRDAARKAYRGASLLRAIRAEGPDRAAFNWFTEELADADLLAEHEVGADSKAQIEFVRAGERARRERLRDYKHGDRRQRAARLPKGPSKEEREAERAAREEAARADRAARLETANVVEIDAAFGKMDDALHFAQAFPSYKWAGAREVEIRVCHLDGDDIRRVPIGRFRATAELLEEIVGPKAIYAGFRPVLDPDYVAPEAAPSKSRRPAWLPGSQQPEKPKATGGITVITYPMPTVPVGTVSDDCPF